MPTPSSCSTAPLTHAAPIVGAGVAAVHQARFRYRTASRHAADPSADRAGCELKLRRAHALLSEDQDVPEIGCGTRGKDFRLFIVAGKPA